MVLRNPDGSVALENKIVCFGNIAYDDGAGANWRSVTCNLDFVKSAHGGVGPVEIGIRDFDTVDAEIGGGANGNLHLGIVDDDGVGAGGDADFVNPAVVDISYENILIVQCGHSVEEIGTGDIDDFGYGGRRDDGSVALSKGVHVDFPDGVYAAGFDEGVVDLGGGDDVEYIFCGFGDTEGTFISSSVEGGDGDRVECVCGGDEEDLGSIKAGDEKVAVGSDGEVLAPGGEAKGFHNTDC